MCVRERERERLTRSMRNIFYNQDVDHRLVGVVVTIRYSEIFTEYCILCAYTHTYIVYCIVVSCVISSQNYMYMEVHRQCSVPFTVETAS